MKLFDYIKILFGTDAQWNKLKSYDKSKNSFMTNRFLSIRYPQQASMFNALKKAMKFNSKEVKLAINRLAKQMTDDSN